MQNVNDGDRQATLLYRFSTICIDDLRDEGKIVLQTLKDIFMLHPRARTMLLLSIPAVMIGIACSLVLIVAMKIAAMLQHVLWSSVPMGLGIEASGPLWTIAILTLTGIAVGLVVRFSPGMPGRIRPPNR
jgi:H+/Cl- antiporter ClcA